MAVLAEVLAGVVAEAEVSREGRVDLHATARAPIALQSKTLLEVPEEGGEGGGGGNAGEGRGERREGEEGAMRGRGGRRQ